MLKVIPLPDIREYLDDNDMLAVSERLGEIIAQQPPNINFVNVRISLEKLGVITYLFVEALYAMIGHYAYVEVKNIVMSDEEFPDEMIDRYSILKKHIAGNDYIP